MTKRVGLFLGAAPHFGGAFQYAQTILDAFAHLPRSDFTPVIGYAHSSWPDYLSRYSFETIRIPLGYLGRFFGQLLHHGNIKVVTWRRVSPSFHPAVGAFLRAGCDVWLFPAQDPWCYLSPVPALATIHDLMHRYERRFPEVGNRKEYSWREWHYRNTCRWSQGILVDSRIGRQQVLDSYEVMPEKIHVLPYCPPTYPDINDEADKLWARSTLPHKYLFYPAQFWEHKNHKLLVRAVGILKGRFPDIRLVLAGAPKNGYASAQALVRQLGLSDNVQFLGYVPESRMPLLYRRARALVMPTFFGPTNIPPLEAMKLGCPVAVSNIYGMPEQTKGAALLFDPESEQSVADAVKLLWENDTICTMLTERGKKVSCEWTLQSFALQLESVLRTLFLDHGRDTS